MYPIFVLFLNATWTEAPVMLRQPIVGQHYTEHRQRLLVTVDVKKSWQSSQSLINQVVI